MNKITVIGELGRFPFKEKKIIKKVVNQTFKTLHLKKKNEISFLITDSKQTHEYNLKYRNVDRPTDVISFAYIDGEDDKSVLPKVLGDIIINYEFVFTQAEDYGHSVLREFAFLVCHGMLHILGFDHTNEEDEKVMFGLQNEILNKINIPRK